MASNFNDRGDTTPSLEDVSPYTWDFVSPTRLMFGASYTFGKMAVISVDYERDWYNGIRAKDLPSGFDLSLQDYRSEFTSNFKGSNTLRVGAEVKPLPNVALRAGYGFAGSMLRNPKEWYYNTPLTYQTTCYSAGVGFAIGGFTIDLAYQYLDTKNTSYYLYYALDAAAGMMDTASPVYSTDYTRHYAILPAPSQKLTSYALVRASSLEVFYQDKPRTIAGAERMLIPEGLLQCSEGVSSKQVIDTVARVVAEVAEEHGANTATALAAAKAAMVEAVEADEELPPWDVVDEAFEDEPVLRDAVKQALREEQVPERVPVERAQVERAAVRNVKIRTDTGIEITIPAEMANNAEYVNFVNEPNGLISIELKNIGSIQNRSGPTRRGRLRGADDCLGGAGGRREPGPAPPSAEEVAFRPPKG